MSLVLLLVLVCGLSVTAVPASAEPSLTGSYVPITPARVLDTRTGTGAPRRPMGPRQTLSLQVAGRGGVPASGVSAVVANLTVVSPSASMFLTVWPAGLQRPVASAINDGPGKVRANETTSVLGAGGKINIFNSAGTSNVVLDVVGYYLSGETIPDGLKSYGFTPVEGTTIYDSRGRIPLGPRESVIIDEFAEGIRAYSLNVSVFKPTAAGFLSIWDGVGDPSISANIDFAAGQTVSNNVTVKTQKCRTSRCLDPEDFDLPQFTIMNRSAGTVYLRVDVHGRYYDLEPDRRPLDRFAPFPTPRRLVDTRIGLGGTALGTQQKKGLRTGEPNGTVLVANVTAMASTTAFVTQWSSGQRYRPTQSLLHADARQAVAIGTVIEPEPDTSVYLYNSAGRTEFQIDAVGEFIS